MPKTVDQFQQMKYNREKQEIFCFYAIKERKVERYTLKR